jgi:hypothetical protein
MPPAIDIARAAGAQITDENPDDNYVQKLKLHTRLASELARLAGERAASVDLRRAAAVILRAERTDAEELARVEEQLPSPHGLGEVDPMNDPVTVGLLSRLRKLSGKDFDTFMLSTLLANQDLALQLSTDTPLQSAALKAFARRHAQSKSVIVRDLRQLQRSWDIGRRAS